MGETRDVEDGLVQIRMRLGFNRVVRVVGWRAGHDGGRGKRIRWRTAKLES
jgi:hypothetical protein